MKLVSLVPPYFSFILHLPPARINKCCAIFFINQTDMKLDECNVYFPIFISNLMKSRFTFLFSKGSARECRTVLRRVW